MCGRCRADQAGRNWQRLLEFERLSVCARGQQFVDAPEVTLPNNIGPSLIIENKYPICRSHFPGPGFVRETPSCSVPTAARTAVSYLTGAERKAACARDEQAGKRRRTLHQPRESCRVVVRPSHAHGQSRYDTADVRLCDGVDFCFRHRRWSTARRAWSTAAVRGKGLAAVVVAFPLRIGGVSPLKQSTTRPKFAWFGLLRLRGTCHVNSKQVLIAKKNVVAAVLAQLYVYR